MGKEDSGRDFRPPGYVWPLAAVLGLSLVLNTQGLMWGLPELWHPDEVVRSVDDMAARRSLDPKTFFYGSWHRYVLRLAIEPYYAAERAKMSIATRRENDPTFNTGSHGFGRLVSALMGTATVLLVFLLGRRVYSETAGLLGALLLALAPGFVRTSHFATVDVPLTFWAMLGLLLCLRHAERGGKAFPWAAAIVCGLAMSTKFTAALLALPLALAVHVQRTGGAGEPLTWRRFWPGILNRRAAAAVGIMLLACLAGSPFILLHPLQFVGENLHNALLLRGGIHGLRHTPIGLIAHAENLWHAASGPILLLGVAGCVIAWRLAHGRLRLAVLLCGALAIPYYLSFATWHTAPLRYMVPLLPLLALWGGLALARAIERRPPAGLAVVAICAALVAPSALLTDAMIVNETRYDAADWLAQHVRPGETIEVDTYGPSLPPGAEADVTRPVAREITADNPGFRRLKRVCYKLQGRDPAAALAEEERRENAEVAAFEHRLSPEGLRERAPDWIVVTSCFYGRYFRDTQSYPHLTQYYRDLLAGRLGYVVALDCRPPDCPFVSLIADPRRGHMGTVLISPRVVVLRRERGDQ